MVCLNQGELRRWLRRVGYYNWFDVSAAYRWRVLLWHSVWVCGGAHVLRCCYSRGLCNAEVVLCLGR